MNILSENKSSPQFVLTTQCADCGAPEATWCSLNWAISLCIKCSGVHRNLGVKISKVRSLELDTINPLILQMLSKLNNKYANSLLLEKLTDKDNLISEHSPESKRIEFINDKYITKKWISNNSIPDPFDAIKNHDIKSLLFSLNLKNDVIYKTLTPLHAAAAIGDPDIVALTICNFDNIDPLDGNGWTPLAYAVFYEHPQIVNLFIDMGSNPSLCNADLRLMAIAGGNQSVIKQILSEFESKQVGPVTFEPYCSDFAPDGWTKNKLFINDDVL